MIALVLGIQVLLPVAALLWLALAPGRSRAGFALQAAGVGLLLLALALVAQWGVVPWWLPRVYGGVWLTLTLLHALRARASESRRLIPSGAAEWSQVALSILLVGFGAWYAASAIAGRRAPPVAVVDVANPLGPGSYLVASGGRREIVNAHVRTLDPDVERYAAWRGQSYAVDFFGLNRGGTRASGLQPDDPTAYAIFGASLHAPCAGDVLAAEDGRPDFRVPQLDSVNRLGNHVLLQCGDAVVVLAHMRRESVSVSPGQRVQPGDRLGEVGNSGASTEPHLHIHAQRPAAPGEPPISGEPLAVRIDGRLLVRNDRVEGRDW